MKIDRNPHSANLCPQNVIGAPVMHSRFGDRYWVFAKPLCKAAGQLRPPKAILYSNVLVRRNRNGERRIIEIIFF